jgi:hypothetical protein
VPHLPLQPLHSQAITQQALFPRHWLNNTLLDEGFIARKIEQLAEKPVPYDLQAWLDQHFDAERLSKRNEAQREDLFIGPLLKQLGWTTAPQLDITVQGKLATPDWCLLLEPGQDDALIASKDHRLITAICESKAWDKTKFADTDFFPQYHSNYRSLKNTEKAAVQKRLLESPQIAEAYAATLHSANVANEYYKDKKVFPLNKGMGDGNLFRLFVERNLGLLNAGGSLNYVLPSALMFEEGSMGLRRHIFTQCRLAFFYSFENNRGIFPDVHRSYKFALMQVLNTPPFEAATTDAASATAPAPIDTAFYVPDPADLALPATHVPYPLVTVKALSPEQWALMELRDGADLPILQKCCAEFSALSEQWLDFRRELHMTDDKDLFIEHEAPGLLPLFEGKMIWQYRHVFEKPQYWLDRTAFDARLHSKELHRMAQDLAVPKSEVEKHADAVRFDREFVRIAFRAIARDTDEHTLIFALLPKNIGLGHSTFANACKTYQLKADGSATTQAVSPLRLLLALALFNRLPVDWLARQMIQINVSQTYLYRLPLPQPTDAEIRTHADYSQLAKNALLLSLATKRPEYLALLQ